MDFNAFYMIKQCFSQFFEILKNGLRNNKTVLKNNIFNFKDKTLKQKRGRAIGRKFAPPYSILFMAELEGEILS